MPIYTSENNPCKRIVKIVFQNHICLGVQSHPEDQGDFGLGLTVNISECNNQLELSV